MTALAFGYYNLHRDVWQAAGEVDVRLKDLGQESVATHAALQARVSALEDELKKLSAAGKPPS